MFGKRKRHKAPAIVYFRQAKNEANTRQLCCYAECICTNFRVGPIWSHSDAAVKRVLATLSAQCDCGRPFHYAVEYDGKRVR